MCMPLFQHDFDFAFLWMTNGLWFSLAHLNVESYFFARCYDHHTISFCPTTTKCDGAIFFSFPRVWQAIIFADVMRHRSPSNPHSIDLLIWHCQMGVYFALIQKNGRSIETNSIKWDKKIDKDCHESNHCWWFFDFSSSISNNNKYMCVCLYSSWCVCGIWIGIHLHSAWINHSNFKWLFIKQFSLKRKTTARFIEYSIKFSMSILHFNILININGVLCFRTESIYIFVIEIEMMCSAVWL